MSELKKLYQARAILATTESGVPSDLLERIEKLENELLKVRLEDFNIAANKLLEDIETPFVVTVVNEPKQGVSVSLKPQKGKIPPQQITDFHQYLENLDVKDSTIKSYKRALDDSLVYEGLDEFAGVEDIWEVTDYEILKQLLAFVPTSYKGGFPHAMIVHYVKFLEQTGKLTNYSDEDNPAKPSKTRTIPNRGLTVIFSDGTIINEKQALETLRKAIIKIGPQRVRDLGLRQCGIPFIDDHKANNPKYALAQKPVGDGLFVMTCSDTPTKKRQLEEISKRLGIKLRVAIK